MGRHVAARRGSRKPSSLAERGLGVQADDYRAFTNELAERVRRESFAIGLVAVGSMADRDYSADEWSDHDFFVITHRVRQEALRTDIAWLPSRARIVLEFKETEHGVTVVYD